MAGAGVEEENKDMPESSLLSSEKQLWHGLFFPHLFWLLSLRKNCQRKETPLGVYKGRYKADKGRGLPEALIIRDIRDPSTTEKAGTERARNGGWKLALLWVPEVALKEIHVAPPLSPQNAEANTASECGQVLLSKVRRHWWPAA